MRLFGVPGYVLPPPTRVFAAMLNLPGLNAHLFATLLEAVAGLLISVALGALLALLMDAFSWFKRAMHPLLVVSQTVPVVVLAPLLLLYLGFGYAPKIATVVLMCFFPIAVSLSDALGAVPRPLVSGFGGLEVACWPLVPKFAGSNRPKPPDFFQGCAYRRRTASWARSSGNGSGATEGSGS